MGSCETLGAVGDRCECSGVVAGRCEQLRAVVGVVGDRCDQVWLVELGVVSGSWE